METVAFWAPWAALAIHLALPFYLTGRSPNAWVWLGVLSYIGTWFISNLWQVAFWLPAYGAIEQTDAYGLALRLKTFSEQIRQVFYLGLFFAFYVLAARQLPSVKVPVIYFTPIGFPWIKTRVLLTFSPLPKPDLQAKLVWLILLVAETFAIAEYVNCKLFWDPLGREDYMLAESWGLEVSRYACGRVIGTLSPSIAPIITGLWIFRVIMARRGNARDARP